MMNDLTDNNNITVTVKSSKNNKCNNMMKAEEKLPSKILKCFQHLASIRGIASLHLLIQSFSEAGENSFGQIYQVTLIDVNRNNNNNNHNNKLTNNDKSNNEIEAKADFSCIVKISPKNPKRRLHMRVVDYYAKEVFTYSNVFQEYYALYEERLCELNKMAQSTAIFETSFNVVPQMYYSCLDVNDEFLILEDLSRHGFKMNSRMHTPNYDLVIEAFRAIAHLHAMSFVLQVRKPQIFAKLLPNLNEHLFTDAMPAPTEQFAKRYLKRARLLFEQCYKCPTQHSKLHIKILKYMENNFKRILVDCVKPDKAKPYAVISHGDFWNNNILYKYDDQGKPISAKLIDFQICRYNAPVLDLVHYLYTCTEKELRDKHFWEFMDCYYVNLERHLHYYDLSIDIIYPRHIFLQQLNNYGIYGFCMAVFSLPFFISTKKEMLDFDEVAEAIEINECNTSLHSSPSSASTTSSFSSSSTSSSSVSSASSTSSSFGFLEMNDSFGTTNIDATDDDDITIKLKVEEAEKYSELWKEYDMLNERTIPIFKKRISGILEDIIQYKMIDNIINL